MTRGVLRFDRHIAKTYPDDESLAASVRAVEASSSLPFPTARGTAVVPDLLLATQTLVPGRRPEGNADTAALAGTLLAQLHSMPSRDLSLQPPRDQLRWVAKQTRLLASIAPDLASRLNRLLAALEASMPSAELVLSHGDFHSSQLLQSDGELGVVDFDGMCLAPAALDIASYVVPRVARPEDLAPAAATLEILVDAYGSRPQGIRWYLAGRLLRHARRPFVRFNPGWPDEVEACVSAAEASLEL
jgi:aminoglycoside phosphotransferase (APT) family kinase protein